MTSGCLYMLTQTSLCESFSMFGHRACGKISKGGNISLKLNGDGSEHCSLNFSLNTHCMLTGLWLIWRPFRFSSCDDSCGQLSGKDLIFICPC